MTFWHHFATTTYKNSISLGPKQKNQQSCQLKNCRYPIQYANRSNDYTIGLKQKLVNDNIFINTSSVHGTCTPAAKYYAWTCI